MGGQITWRVALAGEDQVRRSLDQLGVAGDSAMRRVEDGARRAANATSALVKAGGDDAMVRQLDRASAAADRAAARYRLLADQIAKAQAASPIQARINETTGVGRPVYSAQDSAAAFVDLAARAQALQDAIRPAAAAERKMGAAVAEASALLAAGAITETEHAAAVALAKREFTEAEKALGLYSRGVGLNRVQMLELTHVARSMVDGIAAGASPVRLLAMEGGRLGQVLAEGGGGIAGAARAVGAALFSTAGAVGAIVAAFGAAAAAAFSFEQTERNLQNTLRGTGAASGATVEGLEGAASAAAHASGESVAFATQAAQAFAATGRVTAEQIGPATAVVRDFAVATGQDGKKALEELGKAFADPAKGAEELNSKLSFLSAAQLEHIRRLEEQGDRTGALNELLAALSERVSGAAARMDPLSKALHGVAAAFSDAWTSAGRFFDRLAGGGVTDAEAIARLQRQRANLVESDRRSGVVSKEELASIDRQIAAHRAAIQQDSDRSNSARADQRSVDVRAAADALNPQAKRIAEIEDHQKVLRDALKDPALLAKSGLSSEQARRDLSQGDRELKSLRRQQARDAEGEREAREAEAAANRRAAAEKATETATGAAARSELQANIQIAAARAEQARAALKAVAEDATLTGSERAALMARAAAALQAANAGDDRLKLELAEIEEARKTAVSEAELNRQFTSKQRERVVAAANAAAAAKASAAREADLARRQEAEADARHQESAFQRDTLRRTAEDPRQSVGARIAASVQLQELERQAQQAELEAALAARGVSKETAEAARKALASALQALNAISALYDDAWAKAAAQHPEVRGETAKQGTARLGQIRTETDASLISAVRANQVQADASDPANRVEHERQAAQQIEAIRVASAVKIAQETHQIEERAAQEQVAMQQRAADQIEGAFHDLVFGGDFRDFGKKIGNDLLEALYQELIGNKLRSGIQNALHSLFSGGGGGGFLGFIGKIFGLGGGLGGGGFSAASGMTGAPDLLALPLTAADGGKIVGPGGPRDDNILAAVSNGEWVINARSSAKYGRLLAAINADTLPHFASGGPVGGAPLPLPIPSAVGMGGQPRGGLTFAPVIHAQGADSQAVEQLRQDQREMWRQFLDFARKEPRRFVENAHAAGLRPFR